MWFVLLSSLMLKIGAVLCVSFVKSWDGDEIGSVEQ